MRRTKPDPVVPAPEVYIPYSSLEKCYLLYHKVTQELFICFRSAVESDSELLRYLRPSATFAYVSV